MLSWLVLLNAGFNNLVLHAAGCSNSKQMIRGDDNINLAEFFDLCN